MKKTLSLLLLFGASLSAAIINVGGVGSTLAGGTVTVYYDDGLGGTVSESQAFADIGSAVGEALLANRFQMRINDDTRGNVWTLLNLHSLNMIGYDIDLSTSIAIFDNDDPSKALNSGLGRFMAPKTDVLNYPGGPNPGVAEVTPAVVTYVNPYVGDGGANMFLGVQVRFLNNLGGAVPLAAGDTFEFVGDTDILSSVPEPSTWAMAGSLIALGLLGRRRKA